MQGNTIIGTRVLNLKAPSPWRAVGTPDINRDGKPDILWHNTQNGDVTYWTLDWANSNVVVTGSGYVARGTPTEWRVAGTGDLNGDGNDDVVFQSTRTGDVSYWLLNSTNIIGTAICTRVCRSSGGSPRQSGRHGRPGFPELTKR
jgi:hypothetical protein